MNTLKLDSFPWKQSKNGIIRLPSMPHNTLSEMIAADENIHTTFEHVTCYKHINYEHVSLRSTFITVLNVKIVQKTISEENIRLEVTTWCAWISKLLFMRTHTGTLPDALSGRCVVLISDNSTMGNIHGHKSSHKSKTSVNSTEDVAASPVMPTSQAASVMKLFEVSQFVASRPTLCGNIEKVKVEACQPSFGKPVWG